MLRELDHPRQALAHVTPNWFASVMGTGIVATAAASLPAHVVGLHDVTVAIWLCAAGLLIVLAAATAGHFRLFPTTARRHLLDPVAAPFYGAPPMAVLTVGAGTLLLGRDVIGLRTAVDVDWALWFAGTIGGLTACAVVPFVLVTRHRITTESPFGGWLIPVVPPMVSASTGALLVPHAAPGAPRTDLLLACYAMFGLSLLLSTVMIAAVVVRMVRHGVGPARLVPTIWLALGPLGQSITAANLLGTAAHTALPAAPARALHAFGPAFGLPVLGVALLWALIAGAVTARTAREGMPFSLTWWSFTFPVGTCVTGLNALAAHTGAEVLRLGAVVAYAALVLAWAVVLTRTVRGTVSGRLLLPPVAVRPEPPTCPVGLRGWGTCVLSSSR